jgi:hypothetical protein
MSRLIKMYQAMADMTAPECASSCRAPHSCCDALYCMMANDRARDHGVVLEAQTFKPDVPFLSSTGCVVPPWLRPACTFHTCAINSMGFKPGDPKWTERYFKLREKIEKAEHEKANA